MKKLVKLNENFALTEIDWKATRRQAEKLRSYIKNAPDAESVQYGYQKRFIPLIDGVMNGSIEIPYFGPDPYSIRAMMEGQIPEFVESFAKIFFRFEQMIKADRSAFSLSTHESGKFIYSTDDNGNYICFTNKNGEFIVGKYTVEKDGELYEWCWFED